MPERSADRDGKGTGNGSTGPEHDSLSPDAKVFPTEGVEITDIGRMDVFQPKTLPELKQFLTENGADLEKFKTGNFKDVEQMFKEIQNGEMRIALDPQGNLVRLCNVVRSSVFIGEDILIEFGVAYFENQGLPETLRQELGDLAFKGLTPRMSEYAVWGKLKSGEAPQEAIKREIFEELYKRRLPEMDCGEEDLLAVINPESLTEEPQSEWEDPQDFPEIPSIITSYSYMWRIQDDPKLSFRCAWEIEDNKVSFFSFLPLKPFRDLLAAYRRNCNTV